MTLCSERVHTLLFFSGRYCFRTNDDSITFFSEAAVHYAIEAGWSSDCLPNPSALDSIICSATNVMHYYRYDAYPLCALLSPSVKWGQQYFPLKIKRSSCKMRQYHGDGII